MSRVPFLVTPLDAAPDRTRFGSGSDPLDRYLREQAAQDVRRRVAACFVALTEEPRIAGYSPWPRQTCCWPILRIDKG